MLAPSFIFRDADVGFGRVVDVRVQEGRVAAIGGRCGSEELEIDCAGGGLLPGLHDHHIHLMATAAANESVRCDGVASLTELRRKFSDAVPREGWLRGVGYDDGALGLLDRHALDDVSPDVPLRVQHRSGALWVLNTAAVVALGIGETSLPGVELDAAGQAIGRLWRMDHWLRDRMPMPSIPDLRLLGQELSKYGITGVTDASPDLTPDTVDILGGGALPQRVTLLGDPAGRMPFKIVLADHDLPRPDALRGRIERVRPRPVAMHCVTRLALVIAVAALREAGPVTGDRVEHAAVCPAELAAALADLGVTVVTQPSLVGRRGDEYLDRAEQADGAHLWPFASLLAAGVAVGCSSDAPYGEVDPWRTAVDARDRVSPSGKVVGAGERVSAERAIAGFLTPPDAPGGSARTVRVGADADLVLLDVPRTQVFRAPDARHVRLTMIGGNVVYTSEAAVTR